MFQGAATHPPKSVDKRRLRLLGKGRLGLPALGAEVRPDMGELPGSPWSPAGMRRGGWHLGGVGKHLAKSAPASQAIPWAELHNPLLWLSFEV